LCFFFFFFDNDKVSFAFVRDTLNDLVTTTN